VRHSIEWQDDAVNAAPEERATVGDLRLFLNNQNVTKHLLNDFVGDHVTVALYGLAEGLVHDWWSIFGARDREISLRDYRTGYLLPDIRIQFDGAAFEISAHQTVYTDPDLRFWGGTSEVLSRAEGEAWLSMFVQEVLSRLEGEGIRGTSAALRWQRIQYSRNSQESSFCEAAGSLGLDPYQMGEEVADFIERAESLFETEPLVEFVSGSGRVDHRRLMDWVERMTRNGSFRYRLAGLRPLVEQIAKDVPLRHGEAAWAAGYRRARAMRRALGLRQHHRFASFRDLAQRFGAASSYNLAPKVDGISALRREAADGIHVHIRDHGDLRGATTATHLFALARAIGDAACFPEPGTAPINRLRHAYRQAAGRAFAAELLAPIDEIQSMREDDRDEFSIAAEFGVSATVIEHQIENRDRIAQACAITP
jgi:hypothetical protein